MLLGSSLCVLYILPSLSLSLPSSDLHLHLYHLHAISHSPPYLIDLVWDLLGVFFPFVRVEISLVEARADGREANAG